MGESEEESKRSVWMHECCCCCYCYCYHLIPLRVQVVAHYQIISDQLILDFVVVDFMEVCRKMVTCAS